MVLMYSASSEAFCVATCSARMMQSQTVLIFLVQWWTAAPAEVATMAYTLW